MKFKFSVIVSLFALALLIALCVIITVPKIEQDLNQRSKKALIAAGIDFDNIYFDGQQAILKGTIGSQEEKDRIEKIVSNVSGVVGVSNYLFAQDPIAVIIRATGETTIINPTSGKTSNAKNGTHLINGDKITTGKSGRVELRFLDESNFLRIRPNSICTIKVKKEKNTIAQNIIIEVGAILSRITQQRSSYEVATPTSVAAVKGTRFWTLQESKGATSFLGEEGVVEISNEAGVVLLREGEMCHVISKSSELVVEKINLTNSFFKTVGDNKITFNQSGSSLNQEHFNFLNKVKEFMDQYPIAFIEIQGYTDAIGNYSTNLILSEQRAKAVLEYLITRGGDPASLSAKGYGEKNPIASNSNPDGRRKNRRVEFKVKENR